MSGAMAPFKGLLDSLFLPVADEIGEDLRERYARYRQSRMKRLLKVTQEIVDERQIKPQPVPPKLLSSILENGSLEDDDCLQDRWAALLANTSGRPLQRGELLNSAVDILKQINKWEAMLLDMCMGAMTMAEKAPLLRPDLKSQGEAIQAWKVDLRFNHGFDRSGMEYEADFSLMLENLQRLGLLRREARSNGSIDIFFTLLAYEFVLLCS